MIAGIFLRPNLQLLIFATTGRVFAAAALFSPLRLGTLGAVFIVAVLFIVAAQIIFVATIDYLLRPSYFLSQQVSTARPY